MKFEYAENTRRIPDTRVLALQTCAQRGLMGGWSDGLRMANRASGQDMWALTSTVIDAFCPDLKVELMSNSPCKPLPSSLPSSTAGASVAYAGHGGAANEAGQAAQPPQTAAHDDTTPPIAAPQAEEEASSSVPVTAQSAESGTE